MKTSVYIIFYAILLCIKAIFVVILWNYIVLDMLACKPLFIWQAFLGALCWWIITSRVKIKDGRKC